MFRKYFLFLKFKTRKWIKYNSKKRFKYLQGFEQYFASIQRRNPCNLVVSQTFPSNVFGEFREENWEIIINNSLLMDDDLMFKCMSTLLHEGRHAYQNTHVNNVYNKNKKVFKFSKAYKWRNSFGGYMDASNSDYVDYANQSIELDANMYAYKQLKKLKNKYKNEKLYYEEMCRLEQWLEEAQKMGKEKYGVFYKFKIGRKNKKMYDKNK